MRNLWQLRQWVRRRKARQRSFLEFPCRTNTCALDTATSNMLVQLPAPLLSLIDTFLGCRDKFHLRMTSKQMLHACQEYVDPLYACHFVPTRMMRYACAFRYGPLHALHHPLLQHPVGICNMPFLADRFSLAQACAHCNHTIPPTATMLPTLLNRPYAKAQPAHPSPHDHKCFYKLMQLQGKVPYTADPEDVGYMFDAPYVVEVIQCFGPNDGRKYTGLTCDMDCLKKFAQTVFRCHDAPAVVVGTRIDQVRHLEDGTTVLRLSKVVYMDNNFEMIAEFHSAGNLMKNVKFRYAPMANTDGTRHIFSEEFATLEFLPLRTLHNLHVASQYFTAAERQRERTDSRIHMPSPFASLISDEYTTHHPEGWIWRAMSIYEFVDDPPIPFHSELEILDEQGMIVTVRAVMTYEYSATVKFRATTEPPQWEMEAYVRDRGVSTEENFALLRNLRFNIDLLWDASPVKYVYLRVGDTACGLGFRVDSLHTDERLDEDSSGDELSVISDHSVISDYDTEEEVLVTVINV